MRANHGLYILMRSWKDSIKPNLLFSFLSVNDLIFIFTIVCVKGTKKGFLGITGKEAGLILIGPFELLCTFNVIFNKISMKLVPGA